MITTNVLEMQREVEERKLCRMVTVNQFVERWQGSQNRGATQKESRAQNRQTTTVAYISDTEEIVEESW